MAPLRRITGGALFIYGSGKSFTLETKDFAIQFALSDTGSFRMPLAASAGDTLDLSAMLAGDQTFNMGIVD